MNQENSPEQRPGYRKPEVVDSDRICRSAGCVACNGSSTPEGIPMISVAAIYATGAQVY